MNICRIGLVTLFYFAATVPAQAIFIDFEDLAAASFRVGGMFNSENVQFNVIAYNGAGFTLSVLKSGTPINTRLSMGNSIGVNVELPKNVSFLAFDYWDQCASCSHTGITINGVASSPSTELVNLNGTMLGGASISTGVPTNPAFQHRLTLTGPISSFAIGGTELLFDNLAIEVPEPTAFWLFTPGWCGLLPVRRRG